MARLHIPSAVAVLVAAALACGAAADDRGIHIAGGRSTSFTWYLNDGAGYRWDISSNGQVSDGSNDAYDGGMQLRIGGSYFSYSSQGRLSTDGREVEIGPWKHGNIQVYRRIYIDAKVGYCRWIDLFENTTDTVQTVSLQYYSNMGFGVSSTYTTSGQASLTPKDWGIVTGESSTSSRPAIAHVFANKGSKVKPTFKYTANNDSIYMNMPLKVPARKTVAVCTFQAQRRPETEARKFLKEFNPRKELAKVDPALRRIIVNMGGATLTLGSIDLPRNEKHDLAVLRNENELLGKILNERFDVETFYGKLELPADKVVGINVPAPDDPHVQVVLLDGQVVSGKLLNAPLRIRLTNGNEMALPPSKLAAATFALSPERPGEIKITRPTIMLRSGQQLAFNKEDLDCTYQCQYGTVKLDADDLRGIQFDTPEGGLHRALFRNGSVLSGLLIAEDLKLKLDLGPELAIRRYLASQIVFPAEEVDNTDLAELTLRNEDHLFGRLADESLKVTTQYGSVTVKPSEISELLIPEEGALGQVRIKLHTGTTVTGKFVGDTINFQIDPGPKLPVFLGHVLQITRPKPKTGTTPEKPETPATPGTPTPPPTPGGTSEAVPPGPPEAAPTAPAPVRRRAAVRKATAAELAARAAAEKAARIKAMAADIAALQASKAEMEARAKQLAKQSGDAAAQEKLQKAIAQTAAKIADLNKALAALKKATAAPAAPVAVERD